MKRTRDRILEIIQLQRSETVSGLARALQLAPATVRRHLDILQRDGLVTFTEIRGGAGRPEYSFSLTEAGHEHLPKRYAEMLHALVTSIEGLSRADTAGRSGSEILDAAFSRMADSLVSGCRGEESGDGLAALIGVLEAGEFSPEVRRLPGGGVALHLMSCPFRSVAMSNPAVCRFDTAVVEQMLERPVERVSCITSGDACCTYALSGPEGV